MNSNRFVPSLLFAVMTAGCATGSPSGATCAAALAPLDEVLPVPADSFAVVRIVVAGST